MGLKGSHTPPHKNKPDQFKSDQNGIESDNIFFTMLAVILRSNQTKMGLKGQRMLCSLSNRILMFKSDQNGIESINDYFEICRPSGVQIRPKWD